MGVPAGTEASGGNEISFYGLKEELEGTGYTAVIPEEYNTEISFESLALENDINLNSTTKPDSASWDNNGEYQEGSPIKLSDYFGYDHGAAASFINAKAVSKTLSTGTGNSINFVDTDDTFNFTGTTAFSISFWVKAGWSSSLNTNIHFFIGQKQNASYQLSDMIKVIYTESTNRIRLQYGNKTTASDAWTKQGEWLFHSNSGAYAAGYAAAGLGSTFWSASNRGYVNSDNYTMITVTKSATNAPSAMKLYWNANNAGAPPVTYTSGSGSPTMSTTNNRSWSVGSNGVANGEIKTGNSSATVYNDLTIWQKELSATEVSELYNSGTPLDATSHSGAAKLKGYWKWEGNGNATTSNDNFTISGGSAIVNK
tara:strand:- start:24 stop:1130 length:1107 start_codon:yes stop_codon:yes gene_type:complete